MLELPKFETRKHLYPHGLPFSETMIKSLDALQDRIDAKKASLMIIDGGVGEGKTTLGVEVAEYVQKGPIDFKKQLAVGGEQFQDKMQVCVELSLPVLIYDEAGDFNRRGALTKFNAMLNRVFETYRAFKILVILILPSFGVLDTSLLDKQIARLLLHVEDRTRKWGNFKGYSLYRMFYIKSNMEKLIVKPHAYQRTSPNFRGHYLDLSPERSAELEKISMEEKREIVNQGIAQTKGLVKISEIAKRLNLSFEWVRQGIKKIGAEPVLKYDRARYYNASIIEMLQDERKAEK